MMIKCPLDHLDKHFNRPYVNVLKKNGQIKDGFLFIELEAANEIKKLFGMDQVNIDKPQTKCNSCNQKLPPLTEQISNAAKAIGKVVSAAVSNEPVFRSQADMDKCFNICKSCEFYSNNRCAKCGCYAKYKAKLMTEHCPIDKW